MSALEILNSLHDESFHVIVMDDLVEHTIESIDTESLFTKYCHHYNRTAIFLTQNIFTHHPCSINISINTLILVMLLTGQMNHKP